MSLPQPRVNSTLRARLRANHGNWSSCRPALPSRPDPVEVGAVLGERAGPPDVAEPPSDHQLAQDRQGDADRGERVVDEERAPGLDPGAPVAEVGPGGTVAMGAVDVQHVDRPVHQSMGVGGERGDVAHPAGQPGRRQVALEDGAIRLRLHARARRSRPGRDRCPRGDRWRPPRRRRAPPRRGRSSNDRGSSRSRRSGLAAGRPPRPRSRRRPWSGVSQPSTPSIAAMVSSSDRRLTSGTRRARTRRPTPRPTTGGRGRWRTLPPAPPHDPARARAGSAAGR